MKCTSTHHDHEFFVHDSLVALREIDGVQTVTVGYKQDCQEVPAGYEAVTYWLSMADTTNEGARVDSVTGSEFYLLGHLDGSPRFYNCEDCDEVTFDVLCHRCDGNNVRGLDVVTAYELDLWEWDSDLEEWFEAGAEAIQIEIGYECLHCDHVYDDKYCPDCNTDELREVTK